jgi:toxin ParE1/3/4
MKLRFTPTAIASIEDIGEYTQAEWGVKQRDKYLDMLDSAFHMLTRTPKIGKECNEISPHLRRFPKDKHVIYYRIEGEFITIVRVLHERMEPERYFS